MSLNSLLAASLLFVSGIVLAGPFGLEMGMTLEQLAAAGVDLSQRTGNIYISAKVPRPYPSLSSYGVMVDEKVGLCRVTGTGNEVQTNSYGTQLKEEFNTLRAALDRVYGPGKTLEYLLPGSNFPLERDWFKALAQRERTHVAYWMSSVTGDQFVHKDRVQAVSLQIIPFSPTSGFLMVGYDFDNADSCVERRDSKKSSVL